MCSYRIVLLISVIVKLEMGKEVIDREGKYAICNTQIYTFWLLIVSELCCIHFAMFVLEIKERQWLKLKLWVRYGTLGYIKLWILFCCFEVWIIYLYWCCHTLSNNFECVYLHQVIYNRQTDQSRGFGFVTMHTVEEAEKAVEMFSQYVSVFLDSFLLLRLQIFNNFSSFSLKCFGVELLRW